MFNSPTSITPFNERLSFSTTESNTTKLLDILQPTTEKDIFWEYENIVFQHAHRVSGLLLQFDFD